FALLEDVCGSRGEVRPRLGAGFLPRPAHGHLLHLRRGADADREHQLRLTQIAAAAGHLPRERFAAGFDRDDGSERGAVRLLAVAAQVEPDGMVGPGRFISEDAWLAAVGDKDNVEVAVTVEVRERAPAADQRLEERLPGLRRRDRLEEALRVAGVPVKLDRLRVRLARLN